MTLEELKLTDSEGEDFSIIIHNNNLIEIFCQDGLVLKDKDIDNFAIFMNQIEHLIALIGNKGALDELE